MAFDATARGLAGWGPAVGLANAGLLGRAGTCAVLAAAGGRRLAGGAWLECARTVSLTLNTATARVIWSA